MNPAPEVYWLWLSTACYAAAALLALLSPAAGNLRWRWLLHLLLAAMLATAAAITQRWLRTGQGPFLTMFEVLLSNLFSLGLAYALAYGLLPAVRATLVIVAPVLLLLAIWALGTSAEPIPLPATFEHYWLWLHVLSGKVFLAASLIAVGAAGLLLLHRTPVGVRYLHPFQDKAQLDILIWRFVAIAFVFQSFMLLAGAVWAHDAWGRYWAWDPLETWAFFTWLTLAGVLHARVTFRLPAYFGWWSVIGVFVLAFLTFFGVPFVSLAPHKGVM